MIQIPDKTRMRHFYYSQVYRWLYTGIRLEKEGKPPKLIDKCLNRAIMFDEHYRSLS